MTDYTELTDADLNERMAKALGWAHRVHEEVRLDCRSIEVVDEWRNTDGQPVIIGPFSPSTDSNDLRELVFPEIELRGLENKFLNSCLPLDYMPKQLADADDTYEWFLLTASARILAEAALLVLEESK